MKYMQKSWLELCFSFGKLFLKSPVANGTWHAGFDHAEALLKIQCPALLLQANFEIEEDGILNGAMSQEQAEQKTSS